MRKNAADVVSLLKSLANESRFMVMCVLAEGEKSVGKLVQRIDLSQSALSQHPGVDELLNARRFLFCGTGGRATLAALSLEKPGFTQVYSVRAGLNLRG